MMISPLLCALASIAADPAAPAPATRPFQAPKYGVTTAIPEAWKLAVRERDDRIFVAIIPQADPDRPGVAACELGLAPQTLDDYRTRLDGAAARNARPGGKLVRNQVVKDPSGDRLETLWEFRPRDQGLWREVSVRRVANRQMYTFTLNVDDATYATARPAFDSLVDQARFTPPDTGATPDPDRKGRWIQAEFGFAIDLPEGWAPVLAPDEVALLYANGPAHGIWSDNLLVLGLKGEPQDLDALAKSLPDQLKAAEPDCEVLACSVVDQGKIKALETVVRTRRGPFSHDHPRAAFPGRVGQLRGQVHHRVEALRRPRPRASQEPRRLRRAPRRPTPRPRPPQTLGLTVRRTPKLGGSVHVPVTSGSPKTGRRWPPVGRSGWRLTRLVVLGGGWPCRPFWVPRSYSTRDLRAGVWSCRPFWVPRVVFDP